jgi:hypothetical protein
MSQGEKKLSLLQKKSILLVSGIVTPFLLYAGLSLNMGLLSGLSAALMVGIMLAVILVK